jgi:hypothetical protein
LSNNPVGWGRVFARRPVGGKSAAQSSGLGIPWAARLSAGIRPPERGEFPGAPAGRPAAGTEGEDPQGCGSSPAQGIGGVRSRPGAERRGRSEAEPRIARSPPDRQGRRGCAQDTYDTLPRLIPSGFWRPLSMNKGNGLFADLSMLFANLCIAGIGRGP